MPGNSPLQHTIHQALAHQKAGHHQKAMECYRRILNSLPLHIEANARMGALLLQQGQAEASLVHLERARQAQPHQLQHWVHLLAALQAVGDLGKARELLNDATEFKLSEAQLQRLSQSLSEPPQTRQQSLLQLYQSGQDVLTTEIAARFFMDDYPEHPLGWQILSALLHDTGKLEESLAVKLATVERFPGDANAHNNVAHTFLALQRYEEALNSARAAIKINPSLTQARAHEQQALAGMAKKTE